MPTNPSNIFENNVNSGCLLYSLISPVASVCMYAICVCLVLAGFTAKLNYPHETIDSVQAFHY